MSERGWDFAKRWVVANIETEELEEPAEITALHDHVVALRERMYDDAAKAGIPPVEIDEFYDVNAYISDALKQRYKEGIRPR